MNFVKKYIGLIIGVVVLLTYVLSFSYSVSDDKETSFAEFNMVDIHLNLVIFLIIGLVALCVGFFLYKMVLDIKSGLKLLIVSAVLSIVGWITYATASKDVNEITTKVGFDSGEYQLVGGFVSLTVVLIVVGLIALLGFSIKRMIENATS